LSTQYPDLFADLAAPFEAHEVKSRSQAGRQFHYITARTAMNRLDNVLGPECWWDEYTPGENSVICKLTVRMPDGSTLTKADAGGYAGMSDQGDDDKSGFSDGFKRAAVKFGVGRYLYRDGVPSFARTPQPPPAPAPVATRAPVPGRDKGPGLAPQNGHQLLAWMSRQSRRWEFNLEAEVIKWGRAKGLPGRVIAWGPGDVTAGYQEGCRIVRGLRASTAGVPFDSLATFRIWVETNDLDEAAIAYGRENDWSGSTISWSFDQAVACYRVLADDLAEVASRS
jgi:hypothetical protein